MITIKSPREIETMARAGGIVAATLDHVRSHARPGVSTLDLDRLAEEFIHAHEGATASFKGLYGFPASICASINEEIVHGIPSGKRILKEGDVVSVDVGVCLDGLHADSATTIAVGPIRPEVQQLLEVTQEALAAGIAQVREGAHVGDIGHAIEAIANREGYGVVREHVGHGVGTHVHEDPQVPNYGKPRRGARLVTGLTIAIEPMFNLGGEATRELSDRWTVVTADGSVSAHFEHTVAVTGTGCRILTLRNGQ